MQLEAQLGASLKAQGQQLALTHQWLLELLHYAPTTGAFWIIL